MCELTESVEAAEIARRCFSWEQFLSVVDDWETVQVAHCETVPFRIDRSLLVKSKGFVTAGDQGEKSQQTQRHTERN